MPFIEITVVDGNVVVTLKGMPQWHMVASGETLSEAVTHLAGMICIAEQAAAFQEARSRLINVLDVDEDDEGWPTLDLN